MLSDPSTVSPIRKRTRSLMALQLSQQVNSMGRVGIQVKLIRVEQDRQSVVLELCYSRHEADSNHATTWWRKYWKEPEPHEPHAAKRHRPFRKEMADIPRRQRLALSSHGKWPQALTVLAVGVTYRRPSNRLLVGHVASRRRCRHLLVLDLLLFVVARCPWGRSGEWGLTSRWAPMLRAQSPREWMSP